MLTYLKKKKKVTLWHIFLCKWLFVKWFVCMHRRQICCVFFWRHLPVCYIISFFGKNKSCMSKMECMEDYLEANNKKVKRIKSLRIHSIFAHLDKKTSVFLGSNNYKFVNCWKSFDHLILFVYEFSCIKSFLFKMSDRVDVF